MAGRSGTSAASAGTSDGTGGGQVFVGRGARVVEDRLVEEVAAWQVAVRAEPARLARPLAILVPSRSLRDHVAATLVRRLGALAGVSVQTHHTVALQILERAGVAPPRGADWVPVLVQQKARASRALASLGNLVDGYGAVSAVVSDLLDAGLDEFTAPHVGDFFAEHGAGPSAAWPRAEALVAVALAVQRELEASGLGRLADVIRRARAAVDADAEAFPAGRILLHGYADATGLVTDFLRTLLAGRDSLVLLDRPPDPLDPSRSDLGVAFTERFEQAVAPVARELDSEVGAVAAPRLSFFRAPGTDAEVRAVARRVLARHEAGAAWESIGVVMRLPGPYAPVLRTQFARLGIPFSGVGMSGPRSAAGRRVAFLVDLLRIGERLPADRFVTALDGIGPTAKDDLRLGLHALGVARLGDLASLDVGVALSGEERFALPVRRGLGGGVDAAADAEGETTEVADEPRDPYARRRYLAAELLRAGVARAQAVAAVFTRAEEALPVSERLAGLVELLTAGLGWGRGPDTAELVQRIRGLHEDLPSDARLRIDELALVLERTLRATHDAVGGEGGGVQVLDVVEARARTFEHLFVLGMNRDHFPRVVSDDPLFPDEVRVPLQAVLPELPVLERGHDEERFLFSQLVSSSPDVTLSWQVLGDDGKAKTPSPLVDRLLPPDAEAALVSTLLVPEEAEADGSFPERPAHEWALLAGLHGTAKQQRGALVEAVRERAGCVAAEAERRGDLRARVIHEYDGRREDALLGPYFGHVGPVREGRDLRNGDLWVTTVEGIARCPWQAFLTRLLRLERPPDALEALPEASPLLRGRLVHDVLERIVKRARGDAGGLDATPVAVAWPAPEVLRELSVASARALLLEEGIGVPGYAELLAERMAPELENARLVDWAEGSVAVVGAEVEASTEVAGRTLRFRADRVDAGPGGLRFTDYKTGAPRDGMEVKTPDKRERNLQLAMQKGILLQAAAYARSHANASGRYLFLKPDIDERTRVIEAKGEDAEVARVFEGAVRRVLAASDAGVLVPRLFDPASGDEPSLCAVCEVSLACLRGDSGARRRLADWSDDPRRKTADPREATLRGIWSMEDDGDA